MKAKKETYKKIPMNVTIGADVVFKIENVRPKHPSRKTGKILSFSYWLNRFASEGLDAHFEDNPRDEPEKKDFEEWMNKMKKGESKDEE